MVSNHDSIDPFGYYGDIQPGGNEHLVQINPLTGQFTSVGIIPNVNSVNLGSSTFDQRNNRYIFRGKEVGSGASNLYSVNVNDASLVSNPELTESVIEWEYDLKNSKLYGLKFIQTEQLYDTTFYDAGNGSIDTLIMPIGLPEGNEYLVSLDLNTGENTIIGFIDGVTLVSVNTSTFNSNGGTYIFIGKDTSNVKKLYSIDVATGDIISSPQFTTNNYFELEYNNVSNKLYTIQNGNGNLKYGELDINTANFTLLNDLNFLSGGGVAIGNTVMDQNTGYYIFTGVTSGRNIYVLEAQSGMLISSAPLNEYLNEWEIDNYTNFARVFYNLEDSIEFCNTNLVLDTAMLYSGNYQAGTSLQSKNIIMPNANVAFTAKDVISLQANFSMDESATLNIKTNDCIDDAGCCPEEPLLEPFLQNYIDGFSSFKISQAKDKYGNCIFKIESDYSSSCEAIIADLPISLYDCAGEAMCSYGGFTIYPVNTCYDNYGTSFVELDWEVIYSCDL